MKPKVKPPFNDDYPFLGSMRGDHRVVVDVGLKDGIETRMAVESGFVVYSFEPAPDHCEETRRKLRERNLTYHDVQLDRLGELLSPLPEPEPGKGISYLFCVAAGAEHGWKTFYQDPTMAGYGSSFHDPVAKHWATEIDKEPGLKKYIFDVQVVPISQYVKTDVYFLKSDTQGHDVDVLKGARELFERHVVRLVGVEFWPKGLISAGQSPGSLMDVLHSYNLLCFDQAGGSNADKRDELVHHPEDFASFMKTANGIGGIKGRWGWYTDFVCLNIASVYSHR
ncbi:hypothetical protein CYMTET_38014 [Cymbomonas tetramitiformis]|uniref:Methyltransferase FkbM domain-containing protein n=1 Tax=Cymbomonas tetramitiformis TaxID=36881 RepID=A0AAE0F5M0_9CHLO|nr:hypothetical protein CYMTET_38014 [Cymbomonas tetramitiformis]